ncbi:hypothetical protein BHF71_06615 [Vulcanibacillus modesticaldus]|uniref:HTH cro/C1-type domain-containing protein n=1 Tax=Vulcanibacillus modesticaldus TaxID=337097 RepID=A0A1D2YWF3_9BACI|nr:hypothetical protein [Vulcanibacillus modesticaldus]OEG00029.1 hypothetical protein BHF71_06615 [Vulcanibacillus modesticaldus]
MESRKITRKLKTWKIINEPLYDAIAVKYRKLMEFSRDVGKSHRQVQRWIFEGAIPREEVKMNISKILDKPTYILFDKEKIDERKRQLNRY